MAAEAKDVEIENEEEKEKTRMINPKSPSLYIIR